MATAPVALFAVILRLRRWGQALKPAQQILFGHAVELNVSAGFDLSLQFRIDHRRRRFRLRLIDLDVLLERVDHVLAQVARRELAVADLAQRDDWRRFNTFRSGTRAPGGEFVLETQTRVVRKIIALAGEHRDQTVAIVSHGDPLRAAVAYFMGIPLDMLLRFEVHPASLSVLSFGEWGSKVLCVNDRSGELHWAER